MPKIGSLFGKKIESMHAIVTKEEHLFASCNEIEHTTRSYYCKEMLPRPKGMKSSMRNLLNKGLFI